MAQYVAFTHPVTGLDQLGHYDLANDTVQPLSFPSGHPVENLYQLIEAGSGSNTPIPTQGCAPIPARSVRIRPPLAGRDVLAVGKNYMEHAKEFNKSGFDSSDKVDRPSHPVIFTKRSTSIIAHGEDIYSHAPEFTTTADYEGEIGVIVGRTGFRIAEADAWRYVWGYTIINDITARERQRDHKQFYIGKSADTFCPMGPIAVPKEKLPETLQIQTHVNGELRQDSSTKDLIFSIPELIATLSTGQTLQPGDVLATGTPAGVGIGKTPPVFLKPGDEISISVTGLGTLTNKVAQAGGINPTIAQVSQSTTFSLANSARTRGNQDCLTTINGKPVSYTQKRTTSPTANINKGSNTSGGNIVFVHGLGATKDFWTPLISTLSWPAKTTLHTYDFEGHGLTPTHPLSAISLFSLAADLAGIFQAASVLSSNPATLVAHGFGCLIALKFTASNPGLVKKLVLLNPLSLPLEERDRQRALDRAVVVRAKGMPGIVEGVMEDIFPVTPGPIQRPAAGTTTTTTTTKGSLLAMTAARISLLAQDPEGYAKCLAVLANSNAAELSWEEEIIKRVGCPTLIFTGEADRFSTPQNAERFKSLNAEVEVVVRKDVGGHWSVFEDVDGVAEAVGGFLGICTI